MPINNLVVVVSTLERSRRGPRHSDGGAIPRAVPHEECSSEPSSPEIRPRGKPRAHRSRKSAAAAIPSAKGRCIPPQNTIAPVYADRFCVCTTKAGPNTRSRRSIKLQTRRFTQSEWRSTVRLCHFALKRLVLATCSYAAFQVGHSAHSPSIGTLTNEIETIVVRAPR